MSRTLDLLGRGRRGLADLLESLAPEQLAAPSLCHAWTVREVAEHLTMPFNTSARAFVLRTVAARGDVGAVTVADARSRAGRPVGELAEQLRAEAASAVRPPGMPLEAPLTDLFVHRLDMTVPLGLPDPDGPDAQQAWPRVLGFLVGRRARVGFVPRALPTLSYAASDVAWTHDPRAVGGSAGRVVAPAAALALTLAGRTARLEELEGDGAPALRSWARAGSGPAAAE